jgi:hypothetical protein
VFALLPLKTALCNQLKKIEGTPIILALNGNHEIKLSLGKRHIPPKTSFVGSLSHSLLHDAGDTVQEPRKLSSIPCRGSTGDPLFFSGLAAVETSTVYA